MKGSIPLSYLYGKYEAITISWAYSSLQLARLCLMWEWYLPSHPTQGRGWTSLFKCEIMFWLYHLIMVKWVKIKYFIYIPDCKNKKEEKVLICICYLLLWRSFFLFLTGPWGILTFHLHKPGIFLHFSVFDLIFIYNLYV